MAVSRFNAYTRMTKEIDRLNGHTIICGIGRLGTMLARELRESGKSFVAIDMDRERLRDAEESGYLVLHGDATEEKVLEQAGIARASTVATVLSEDALNVFVTITARELNPEITIIARAENPRTERSSFARVPTKWSCQPPSGRTRWLS
jgi:voltage-gated potassium channel